MKLISDKDAAIIRRDDGELVLLYEGKEYERRDTVPIVVPAADMRLKRDLMATDFAAACVLLTYGTERVWPNEAIEFIFPHSFASRPIPPRNDPSEPR